MNMSRFACLGALSCMIAFAQSDRGAITGTITDPVGAVVANAPVEIRNTGIINLGSKLKHWSHEERPVSLLRSSFPSRNYQLCGLGLPSFLP